MVSKQTTASGGMSLPHREWVFLNFRSGAGRDNYWQCKWGLIQNQLYDCIVEVKTMNNNV